jgi:CDP-paratose 2-epimerase
VDALFRRFGGDIGLVIHTAAQPSHDWAARDPHMDFTVNANGTLNVLEAARRNALESAFIFTSTNKVYGDTPNRLPLLELETRWEIDPSHTYVQGIREDMSIDQTTHSLFGASKVAADVLVQEYGRYFGMKTATFRGGCLTGPNHSGTQLHGFLAYLMKCAVTGTPYTVFGYKGKQVRDNIHSEDVATCIHAFWQNPRIGEVYNLGGGKANTCSILEAFELVESFTGKKQRYRYVDEARIGDHICYYSDLRKMKSHYPHWELTRDLRATVREIVDVWQARTERA